MLSTAGQNIQRKGKRLSSYFDILQSTTTTTTTTQRTHFNLDSSYQNIDLTITLETRQKTQKNRPTVVPIEGNRPTLVPIEGNRPTLVPIEGNRPTLVPIEGNRPTLVPIEGNRPTLVPIEGNRPTLVPIEGNRPTLVPIEGNRPTVVSTLIKQGIATNINDKRSSKTDVNDETSQGQTVNELSSDTGKRRSDLSTNQITQLESDDESINDKRLPTKDMNGESSHGQTVNELSSDIGNEGSDLSTNQITQLESDDEIYNTTEEYQLTTELKPEEMKKSYYEDHSERYRGNSSYQLLIEDKTKLNLRREDLDSSHEDKAASGKRNGMHKSSKKDAIVNASIDPRTSMEDKEDKSLSIEGMKKVLNSYLNLNVTLTVLRKASLGKRLKSNTGKSFFSSVSTGNETLHKQKYKIVKYKSNDKIVEEIHSVKGHKNTHTLVEKQTIKSLFGQSHNKSRENERKMHGKRERKKSPRSYKSKKKNTTYLDDHISDKNPIQKINRTVHETKTIVNNTHETRKHIVKGKHVRQDGLAPTTTVSAEEEREKEAFWKWVFGNLIAKYRKELELRTRRQYYSYWRPPPYELKHYENVNLTDIIIEDRAKGLFKLPPAYTEEDMNEYWSKLGSGTVDRGFYKPYSLNGTAVYYREAGNPVKLKPSYYDNNKDYWDLEKTTIHNYAETKFFHCNPPCLDVYVRYGKICAARLDARYYQWRYFHKTFDNYCQLEFANCAYTRYHWFVVHRGGCENIPDDFYGHSTHVPEDWTALSAPAQDYVWKIMSRAAKMASMEYKATMWPWHAVKSSKEFA